MFEATVKGANTYNTVGNAMHWRFVFASYKNVGYDYQVSYEKALKAYRIEFTKDDSQVVIYIWR